MIGIILAILGVMLILWWIWDSYRAAKAERFTIRPLTPEERKEAEEMVEGTDEPRGRF